MAEVEDEEAAPYLVALWSVTCSLEGLSLCGFLLLPDLHPRWSLMNPGLVSRWGCPAVGDCDLSSRRSGSQMYCLSETLTSSLPSPK